jgi:hypothetical protein
MKIIIRNCFCKSDLILTEKLTLSRGSFFYFFAISLKSLCTSKSKLKELFIFDVPAEYEDKYKQSTVSASVKIIDT